MSLIANYNYFFSLIELFFLFSTISWIEEIIKKNEKNPMQVKKPSGYGRSRTLAKDNVGNEIITIILL